MVLAQGDDIHENASHSLECRREEIGTDAISTVTKEKLASGAMSASLEA
jgi:hypothetical protein